MFEICSDRLREAFRHARASAERLLHEEISSEHLLMGLLSDPENQACQTLRSEFKLQPGDVRARLSEMLVPGLQLSVRELPFTPDAREALGDAAELAEEFGHKRIGTDHLLLALTAQDGTLAGKTLRTSNVNIENLRQVVSAAAVSDGIFRGRQETPRPLFRNATVYAVCVVLLFLGPAGVLLAQKSEGLNVIVFIVLALMVIIVNRTFDRTVTTGLLRARPLWGNAVKSLAVLHAAAAISISIITLKDAETQFITEHQFQHWMAVVWCWCAAVAGYMAGDAQVAVSREVSKPS